jgi:glucose-6-phosphate isomerase
MRRGEKINRTERRAVLHTATRAAAGDGPIPVEGGDAVALVHEQQRRIRAFTDAVRAGAPGGAFLGYTGRPIKNIIRFYCCR